MEWLEANPVRLRGSQYCAMGQEEPLDEWTGTVGSFWCPGLINLQWNCVVGAGLWIRSKFSSAVFLCVGVFYNGREAAKGGSPWNVLGMQRKMKFIY